MIDKFKVLDIIQDTLAGSDKFLVNMKITPDNRIFVDIDGDNGINIDDCIELSRAIEGKMDREAEDFELNVSSAGADSPLKMPRQYRRHIGRDLSIETFDEERYEATLVEADNEQVLVRTRGTKKMAPQEITIKYADIKVAKVVIRF